jgi:hypothetical protein
MNKIIEIWKEIIYIAGKYSIYSDQEKDQILDKFKKYKKILNKDLSKYSYTVLDFILDLEWDIKSGRKLHIDNVDHDDFLENYFVTQREISHYNNLIDEDLFIDIFEEVRWNKNIQVIESKIKLLEIIFTKEIQLISHENIAKNLMIFTLFERKIAAKALKRLYSFLMMIPWNEESSIILRKMISSYYILIQEVYKSWIKYFYENNYNVYYMRFLSEIVNWEKIKTLKKYNASQLDFRTWNPKYEYKVLLKKLRGY